LIPDIISDFSHALLAYPPHTRHVASDF